MRSGSGLRRRGTSGKTARGPFLIKGAGDQPIPTPAGEFYGNTKPRARRMMQNPLSNQARRIYACLELATMGYQQELAVKTTRGRNGRPEQQPLTPSDIANETGLSRQHVRRGLAELERAGLAERRPADGNTLRKGQVRLYSWAIPRKEVARKVAARGYNFPAWFPPVWEPLRPLISRFKLQISIEQNAVGGYISEGEAAAHGYQQAEKRALSFLNRICAPRQMTTHKREAERTERTTERSAPATATFSGAESRTCGAPPLRTDEDHVAERLGVDKNTASLMLLGARQSTPSIHWRVVVALADAKRRVIQNPQYIRNWPGLWIKYMREMAKGATLRAAEEEARRELEREWKEAELGCQRSEEALANPELSGPDCACPLG